MREAPTPRWQLLPLPPGPHPVQGRQARIYVSEALWPRGGLPGPPHPTCWGPGGVARAQAKPGRGLCLHAGLGVPLRLLCCGAGDASGAGGAAVHRALAGREALLGARGVAALPSA